VKARSFLFVVFVLLFSAAIPQLTISLNAQQRAAFVRLDRVTGSRALPNGIEIHSGAAIMQITALRDDVVRVRVGPAGQLPEDASWAVLPASRTASANVATESSNSSVGF
jgi:alpha-glucosidase